MGYKIIIFAAVAVIVSVVIAFFLMRKKNKKGVSKKELLEEQTKAGIIDEFPNESMEISEADQETVEELVIKVEELPISSIHENDKLVEITDNKLLARINNLVPGLFQAGVGAGNAASAIKAGKDVVYKAIIPNGATLANSASAKGMFRGFYLGKNGIEGQANFEKIISQSSKAVPNAVSLAMSVGSLIVGQYYMEQINRQISKINNNISKIMGFLDSEYKSKVLSLIVHVKTISDFEMDILENDELRLSKIIQLDNLEEECTQLLGQANIMLEEISNTQFTDFQNYEKTLIQAQPWFVYQKSLAKLLCKISDLRYALHLGNTSRQQCTALQQTYLERVSDTRIKLKEWHDRASERFGVDLLNSKRMRDGVDGAIYFIPGLINKENKFKPIDCNTKDMITVQTSVSNNDYKTDTTELYNEDVQLIAKDGKIYYYPTCKEA